MIGTIFLLMGILMMLVSLVLRADVRRMMRLGASYRVYSPQRRDARIMFAISLALMLWGAAEWLLAAKAVV